ncbi:hypothetical protein K2F45_05685 [Sphingobacterium siyangense]|uniref:hypothetical protein n=1 Tax=Sphingobacterium siyangense TaxID=459529 RepID=UPI00200D2FC7|nr:hypothetical protein [Sphingobacterium siyangense]UQA76484.1 hypothetical protein K2F45_05685 [Sphingobacterium siyangense]
MFTNIKAQYHGAKSSMILLTLNFSFFLLGTSTQALAQFRPPTTIRTPGGNVTLAGLYTPPLYSFNSEPISSRYKFYIVLKNDSTVVAKTKIKLRTATAPSEISWREKGKKYTVTPDQTKEIYRIDYWNKKIKGIPQDSCWLFLVDTVSYEKRIRRYSMTADINQPAISHFKMEKAKEILPLKKETLEPYVEGNEKAKKLLSKNKLLKAIEELNLQD